MGGIPVPMGGVYGPDWHEKLVKRDRQIVAETERAAAEFEARRREREKRDRAIHIRDLASLLSLQH